MPRDAVSRTANVERNGGHKWVNTTTIPVWRNFGEGRGEVEGGQGGADPQDAVEVCGQRDEVIPAQNREQKFTFKNISYFYPLKIGILHLSLITCRYIPY